ncbi:MAG: hypothetical protein DSY77_05050 [Bacteroidetes bacterium]|nr:MAG: hypothetical protein DSY77_05050 [Bacteroidota bacterium]
MRKIILVCFVFLNLTVLGQDNKGSRIILSVTQGIENASFHVYEPPFQAKAIYSDTTEAVNEYPEQLMSSIMSATNQPWVEYNVLGGAESGEQKSNRHFDFISTMNRDSNYFELRSKLMFSEGSREFAIIKFYLHTEDISEDQSGAFVMQKVGDRWYRTATSFTTNIAVMVMRFKAPLLQQILGGQLTGDSQVDTMIQQVGNNGVVDINQLYALFAAWYENNDTANLDYFIDENAW